MPNRLARPFIAVAALTIVIALSAITYFYQRDLRQARTRVASAGQLVDTPCGPIEYATIGDGPPLLIAHGAGGGYDQGLDLGQPLADAGFRVIAVSRFGYLRTPLPADASPAAQADAYACLLDALHLPKVTILGGSAGAPSSMQFAVRHPDRCSGMILLVPLAYVPKSETPPSEISATTEFLFNTALKSDFIFWSAIKLIPSTLIHAIVATPPDAVAQATSDEQSRVMTILNHILPVSERRQGLLNDVRIATALPRYDLERINTPTLIFSVADDLFGTYESARYTAQHIPGARFVGYESGGHLWVGHQQEILNEIARFLRK